MSNVSAVEIYKQTGTDANQFTLMPCTSNFDGKFEGEGIVNLILGLLMRVYHGEETKCNLKTLDDSEGWARIREVFQFMREGDVEEKEYTEYGILMCSNMGYITLNFYNGVRYFRLTKKCMNLELYNP